MLLESQNERSLVAEKDIWRNNDWKFSKYMKNTKPADVKGQNEPKTEETWRKSHRDTETNKIAKT